MSEMSSANATLWELTRPLRLVPCALFMSSLALMFWQTKDHSVYVEYSGYPMHVPQPLPIVSLSGTPVHEIDGLLGDTL